MLGHSNSLGEFWWRLRRWTHEFPLTCLIIVVVLLYAAAQIAFFTTSRENAIPLWILALVLAWRAMESMQHRDVFDLRSQIGAWILIALVPFALQLPGGSELRIGVRCAMMLLAMSVITYSNALQGTLRLMPVLLLTLVIIPVQEQLFLAVSYPLRLISTMLTVETLQMFGGDLSYHLTTIQLGEIQLAITDACSGIAQLAVLLLLGYIVVLMKQHRHLGLATLHYLALLPVVIFANAIRLVITILLFYAIGEKAFGNTYHASLGYVFVILATYLFYAIGGLFPSQTPSEETPETQRTIQTKD
ncbi:exosortase/archaeosortase family protein [Coraliomargarita algicola]|uniref:Exosortase/archaeosortase family protein n=1 Tax=Coraliomargarita algicola TaxID=3092156 RepID=A0ABZ0RNZ9_9BACT|nr:exosortase/archaeosortase family protein [Coraliomargarita sp. J2-16]WPJ96833.1 exosortase/archaeosortase family protein [Coraliomargarita sp. J2-16]